MPRLRSRLLTRAAMVIALALLPAVAAQATFCAPPSPTPKDTPPAPDNPPSCGPKECEKCNASPCFAKTGVYTASATDLHIPTTGFPLVVRRSYESSHLVDGALGYGWRSNFSARLYYATYMLVAPATFYKEAVIVMPDGESYRYRENADASFTPPAGRRDTLVRLGDGTFQLTIGHSSVRYAFAADGALLTIRDDHGNTLRFSHDAARRINRVDDESGTGRYLIVTWNPSGRIGSVEDHTGRLVSYGYGTNGTLTSVTNPAGQSTFYSYEQRRFAPLLSQIMDHWDRVLTELTWDALDRLETYTEGGETYTMAYMTTPTPQTTKTHSRGAETIHYDANGLVTSRGGETMSYNTNGDLLSSGSTQYTYTADGRMASVKYEPGAVFHYTYDTTYPHKVATVVPRINDNTGSFYNGHWLGWKYTYYTPADTVSGALPGALKQIERMAFQDQTHTVLTDGDPVSLHAQFSYDGKGRVTRSWNRTALETKYLYDDAANKLSVSLLSNSVGPVARVTTYAFDALGRTSSVTDPMGHVTSHEYDALDRVTKMTLPKPTASSTLSFVTTFVYDQAGSNPALVYTHVTDPNNRLTKQGYDAFGHLIESIDAAGNITSYGYAGGLLTSITDANGNITSYAYDSRRRLSSTTFPDGKTESYAYFANDKLQSKTDRKGLVTTYAYDVYGRLTSQITGGQSRSYSYLGEKLMTLTDSYSGTTDPVTYTYDPKTFLPLSEKQGGSVSSAHRGTIDYTWRSSDDLLGQYKVTDAEKPTDWQTVDYGYAADGSVIRIHWSRGPGRYDLEYNANGQQTEIEFPNGQTRNLTYDNQGRLTKISNLFGTTNLATFEYEYDKDHTTGQFTALGQRTKVTATVPSLASGSERIEYSYDANYQLIRAKTTSNPTSDRSWTYDAIGNRLTQTINTVTTSYSYVKNGTNPNNSARLAGAGYDQSGNMTTFGGVQYTWDSLNRMKTGMAGPTHSFTYDGMDRRIRIDDEKPAKFLYHGLDLVDLAYREGAGYYRSNYLFGPGIDQPLARTDHIGTTYYAVDGLGSVILLTDDTGAVKNKYTYGPWGEVQTSSEQFAQPFTYTARESAVLTPAYLRSQHYYRARYMAPNIGRFVSEDPLGVQIDMNSYRYVENSPLQWTDPLGLMKYPIYDPFEYEDLKNKCIANAKATYLKELALTAKKLQECLKHCKQCHPEPKPVPSWMPTQSKKCVNECYNGWGKFGQFVGKVKYIAAWVGCVEKYAWKDPSDQKFGGWGSYAQ